MANTYVDYTGNGSTTDFNFSFPYIKTSHVVVQVNEGQGAGGLNKWVPKVLTTDYSVETSPTTFVRFVTAPANNVRIRVLRDSDASTGLVDFANGSVLTETELDNSYEHNRYLAEEAEEGVTGGSLVKNTDGQFDADGLRLENLADPDSDDDAVNKGYADNRYVEADGDTMRGPLTLNADPDSDLHAATKQYADTKVSKAGDTMTGELNMGSNKITNLSDPVNPQEAATKNYVDEGGVGIATEDYVNQQISNTITGSSTESLKYVFTGDGASANFAFSPGISLDGDTMYDVFISGICQEPGEAYGINASTNTISFTSAPPNNSRIVVVQRGYSVPVSDKVTTNDITNDAVTADKLDDTGVVAGSYTTTDLTVDAQGRITAASNGTPAATNLGSLTSGTSVTVTSSTGSNAVIGSATGTQAGVMSSADRNKLDGITPGAETNVQADWTETNTGSDSFILNKPTTLGTPTGTVLAYAGAAAPTGYLICNLQAVSRTTFADLFGVIGTTYGPGNGSTTFNVPDLRGRVIAGVDNASLRLSAGGSGISGALASFGGDEVHTLTAAQSGLPSHSHSYSTPNAAFITGGGNPGFSGTTTGTTGAAGGQNASQAHSSTQPTLVLNYIIKT